MTSYIFQRNEYKTQISESSGIVQEAGERLDWAIGLSFSHVLQWAERKGYRVIPVAPARTTNHLEYNGYRYDVFWHHDSITAIWRESLETGKRIEITYGQLPEALQQAL